MRQNPSEFVLVGAALGILGLLFVPISAFLLDCLLVLNVSFALTILLITLYTEKPLRFSTFPALLLIATLFRLSLNISATRLILRQGEAGQVIHAVGEYAIQGNWVMGVVVFLILIIVQFVVVTNGAQRVAEVAARFTLDSMPGKQMSIDADLNMGIISQQQAQERRAEVAKEANFYGAMDGASKFVKGDAIAGILILLVDIIAGIAIGTLQRGLQLSASLQTYTLLTIGDGIITQVPAFIIALAMGILVTRAATDAALAKEITQQWIAYPRVLSIVSFALFSLLWLKGIPALPVGLFCLFYMSVAYYAKRPKDHSQEKQIDYEKVAVKTLELRFSPRLWQELQSQTAALTSEIQSIREQIALELGLIIGDITFSTEDTLLYPQYAFYIQGHTFAHPMLYPDKLLAIGKNARACEGIEVGDPYLHLPAKWIDKEHKEIAIQSECTVVEPLKMLVTHVREALYQHIPELLTRKEMWVLLESSGVRPLKEELIPSILSISQVQKVLQGLLQEKVSIRNLGLILEVLLEHGKTATSTLLLTELVRAKLSFGICQKLLNPQNQLEVLTLEEVLEQQLQKRLINNQLVLDPSVMELFLSSLAKKIEEMLRKKKAPILLCSSLLRWHLKQTTLRIFPHLTVLAMSEIPMQVPVESFGTVTLGGKYATSN